MAEVSVLQEQKNRPTAMVDAVSVLQEQKNRPTAMVDEVSVLQQQPTVPHSQATGPKDAYSGSY